MLKLIIRFLLICLFWVCGSISAANSHFDISTRPICPIDADIFWKMEVCRLDDDRFVATLLNDSSSYIQLYYFEQENLVHTDSIAITYSFFGNNAFKFIYKNKEEVDLYWLEIDNLGHNNSGNLVIFSCRIGERPCPPKEIGRFNAGNISFPEFYFDQNKKIVYLIYNHSGEKHYFLRVDNMEVNYMKDYYRIIGDSSISNHKRIQPKGKYNIDHSTFLLNGNSYYSLYEAKYDNREDSVYIYLDRYSDWNMISHRLLIAIENVSKDMYFISPFASFTILNEGAIFWEEYHENQQTLNEIYQALNYVRIKDDTDSVKVISMENISNCLDAVMNTNGEIIILTNHKYSIINSLDSLVYEANLPYNKVILGRFVPFGKDDSSLYGIVIQENDNKNGRLEFIKIQ
jgi:hypothetical protein